MSSSSSLKINQFGFNRVEIVILLTIIISLIVLFLNFVFDVQKKARDAKRHGDIEEIAKQLEVHFNNRPNQFCPDATTDTYCAPKTNWFDKNIIPVDPLGRQPYLNLPQNGSKNFFICAKLEKGDQFCEGGQQ